MSNQAPFTIRHLGEFEHPWPQWLLARKGLDCRAFGINVIELAPGERITEHDEVSRSQEEVFVTLEGSPSIVIDGEAAPAPTGTFVRISPEPKRYVHNDSATTARILVISAPTTSGYQPMDWA
jgi:uncharacterized cupin superfamily protein